MITDTHFNFIRMITYNIILITGAFWVSYFHQFINIVVNVLFTVKHSLYIFNYFLNSQEHSFCPKNVLV
jgi:hypothetical protein